MDTSRVDATPNVFATPVQTPETMAAQVRMQLERRLVDGLPPEIDLADIARQAVDSFQAARVKTFIPVLAVREAREMMAQLVLTHDQ
jgi:hypothetical protein